ncbi:PTS N-acetylgalactosamine transporter subunit IIC [Tepidanaerobacter syntrophicus]|uniref:PTS system, N-acetylgalactosamine-specific IIC component n=1 Tax=Tepidanaerobacter syntrophicus TaxID=224999 RepID=A0A0U9HKV3_9FIRM|nr:PTS N-acetylgalactosamine transporter subunit IIC [Tepidanaerobacter syntrophicus]GAQ26012.1 PTS system, N-acetylgalactosamine-specific IIC component [Tepidanaerobacter syntrophicus]GLI19666.1 PTS acetylgalactosamine transporter subunit IIC [Tepidanaerobacter syntrophicus]HHV83294.1 PTS sugar transporter subunit IIC [Tepidanaerobacter syntrophicus]
MFQALMLALISGLAGLDILVVHIHWHRPLVTGLLVGLVLGDVKAGLIAGATLELAWMGLVPLAGAQPPDPIVGGILGTAFAIITKQPPQTAVAFAIPFAIAAQSIKTLLYTAFSYFAHLADKYAEDGNYKMIERINIGALVFHFLLYAIIVFLPIYFGMDVAKNIVSLIPEKLMNGLAIAGGIMPAVGLATLLKIMLKSEFVPFLILGFICSVYLQLPVLAVALIGVAIAIWEFYIDRNRTQNAGVGGGENDEGI